MKTQLIRRRICYVAACWTMMFAGWSMAMPTEAWGVPVTFRFDGEAIEVDDAGEALGDAITAGSRVDGTFVFESTVADSDPDPGQGLYSLVMLSWEMDLGDGQFSLANFDSVYVENRPGGDKYQVFARLESSVGGLRWNTSWDFNDSSGDLLASTALPLMPPDVLPLQTATSVQFLDPDTLAVVRVRLDTFELASASQPGDLDLDGDVDFDDIGDFVIGINDLAEYQAKHGVPPWASGDTDGDGDFDFDDIPGFVELLGGEAAVADASLQAVPEPTSALLALVALSGVCWPMFRRRVT